MKPYLNSFRDFENIYYLNKAGRELVGSPKVITKTVQYKHTLMRNDVYIHFDCPKMWINEHKIPLDSKRSIVTDALFQIGGDQYFLEVDNLQKMKVNFQKLHLYKELYDMGKWQHSNQGRFPVILFYTNTISRKSQLLEKKPIGLHLHAMTKKDLQ